MSTVIPLSSRCLCHLLVEKVDGMHLLTNQYPNRATCPDLGVVSPILRYEGFTGGTGRKIADLLDTMIDKPWEYITPYHLSFSDSIELPV